MSVACTIGMAELQHDEKCKNDYKSGAIVFTGGTGLDGAIPVCTEAMAINLNDFRWQPHCRGLFELPVAA